MIRSGLELGLILYCLCVCLHVCVHACVLVGAPAVRVCSLTEHDDLCPSFKKSPNMHEFNY